MGIGDGPLFSLFQRDACLVVSPDWQPCGQALLEDVAGAADHEGADTERDGPSIIMSSLAHGLIADTSVGLNAVAVQKPSDR
jgi:hypothetical protein